MREKNNTELVTLFHQTEDYFFSSISKRRYQFNKGVSAYLTGVEVSDLNLLIVKQFSMLSDVVLQEGVRLFEDAGLPFSVVIQNNVGEPSSYFDAPGFTRSYTSTCMQLNMNEFNPVPAQSDEYKIDCTDARLTDWAVPLESAFDSDKSTTLQYQARHQAAIDAGKALIHFTLYIKTVPVCSLTLSIQHRIARLDDAGTQIEFQGKGYASALLQRALMYAKSKNSCRCFLEASSEGASVYRRIGFTDLFEYTGFSR